MPSVHHRRFIICLSRYVKTLLASMMIGLPLAGYAGDGGVAIGRLWTASAAEYQATAEAQLEALGARNIQRPGLSGALVADFLLMFSGGGGAPLDLVRPRAGAFAADASADAQM
jgi:hypothetical protein